MDANLRAWLLSAPRAVSEWYMAHVHLPDLAQLRKKLHERNFRLEPTGILSRPAYKIEHLNALGYSIADVVLTSPTDFCAHENMGMLIKIADGPGLIVLNDLKENPIELETGAEHYIAAGTKHALVPIRHADRISKSELRVNYSGLTSQLKSNIISPFYEWSNALFPELKISNADARRAIHELHASLFKAKVFLAQGDYVQSQDIPDDNFYSLFTITNFIKQYNTYTKDLNLRLREQHAEGKEFELVELTNPDLVEAIVSKIDNKCLDVLTRDTIEKATAILLQWLETIAKLPNL